MRITCMAIAACAFFSTLWTLARQPQGRVSWMVIGYFASHAIFVLGMLWEAMRYPGHAERYMETYRVLSAFPLFFACGLALHFMIEGRSYALVSGLAIAFGLIAYAYQLGVLFRPVNGSLHPMIRWNLALAVGFISFGVIAFLTLHRVSGDIETNIRVALAALWVVFGAYHFAFPVAKLNGHLGWITRMQWLPPFAAVVCCFWLTYKLNSSQRELSFRALPDVQAVEQRVAEPDYE